MNEKNATTPTPRRGSLTADLGRTALMTKETIDAALDRVAAAIAERYQEASPVVAGIHTRGVIVADRLRTKLAAIGCEVRSGTLDISLYRDDLDNFGTMPSLKSSDLPPVDGSDVILVDDVLFTGRTIRAAIDGVTDFGRPRRIELAVLVDRGNRELPIQADYVGETFETERTDYVAVHLDESDGEEGVFLLRKS